MVILEGRGGASRLRRAGYAVERFLTRPRMEDPQLIIPLDRRAAAAYAARHWTSDYTHRKRARNRIAGMLFEAGLFPELPPITAVGVRAPGPPYIVAAAADLGVPAASDWFLTLAKWDVLSRNVFHLFPPGATEPVWVLKYARVPGYEEPFRGDERGLRLAREAGLAGARAPEFVGRFQVDGLHASVETAVVGRPLRALLIGPGAEREKLRLVDDVASWLIELARETAGSAEALEPERTRVLEEVVAPWLNRGADPDIVRGLPPVPSVLQHSDVHVEHIVVGSRGFTLLDWEHARRPGFPLWDLIYFLTHALFAIDSSTGVEPAPWLVRLLRGELPKSPILFRWLRAFVDALGLPDEAVGRIATLVWLADWPGDTERGGAIRHFAPDAPAVQPLTALVAPHWLRDPALGPAWSRWREG